MKKIAFVVLGLFLLFVKQLFAQEPIKLYFFWAEGCPHCAKEEIFLDELQKEIPNLEITRFEVSQNTDNARLLGKVGKELGVAMKGVPVTVVARKYVVGFYNFETTGGEIRAMVSSYSQAEGDLVDEILKQNEQAKNDVEKLPLLQTRKIQLPFVGEIDLGSLSLPLLTVVVAGIDGFNPCAMWVLIFLIGIFMGMRDRRKMWILGFTFIATSAGVYFLFLTAWLNLFLFLGFLKWVRIGIGVFALFAGAYQLREFYVNKNGACKVGGGETKKKVFDQAQKVIGEKRFYLSFLGIIVLAAGVNMIEMVCSAGLPAIYTQVLSLTPMVVWKYYLYLFVYIVIFMLDDLLVFVVAMMTLKFVGISGKYVRYSSLVGGLIILVVGILMLVRPQALMFG
ncbi:hypothetical protein A2382_04680 [Candidatus Woesebacteria bacterium RIFOXYB1_FULL_38_16]|uniref:Thioredoxin domain-containing protein n=1 Tax=Candidatus Woesebacteria bacterium RIFOXYB1_FULL_38_16 TaxID=1802538 RepID=A0A1F8CUF6_9BACT|nr:MAG: hypothetical protein A2191_02160 [Candidatus Woesebacteria bacterium RIFOXYA1_FULL_38_9]OGM79954.1 MAG: hypothetical protein A2382_04680 [Candidatus Woesebacteria bacterium RIFOXYB1_FULL_38_16]